MKAFPKYILIEKNVSEQHNIRDHAECLENEGEKETL